MRSVRCESWAWGDGRGPNSSFRGSDILKQTYMHAGKAPMNTNSQQVALQEREKQPPGSFLSLFFLSLPAQLAASKVVP